MEEFTKEVNIKWRGWVLIFLLCFDWVTNMCLLLYWRLGYRKICICCVYYLQGLFGFSTSAWLTGVSDFLPRVVLIGPKLLFGTKWFKHLFTTKIKIQDTPNEKHFSYSGAFQTCSGGREIKESNVCLPIWL